VGGFVLQMWTVNLGDTNARDVEEPAGRMSEYVLFSLNIVMGWYDVV
jgi:hypothetical protein